MISRSLCAGVALAVASQGTAPYAWSQVPAMIVISGAVTSDLGEPLVAANVLIPELGVSVPTNSAGRYAITLAADRASGRTVIVRARFFGFKPAERRVAIGDSAHTVNFVLTTDVNRLDEVVITGVTGATSKRNLPFAVDRIGPPDLLVPAADALTQLAGKVPGAQVTSFNGRPGGQPAILLRGPRSIDASGRGQNPLFIVDGIVINGSLTDLNPQDIESIEVVKGAAAATLYGSRAGNGVMQITTKRASSAAQGTRFHIRTEYGRGDISGILPLATHNAMMMDESGTRFCVRVIGNVDCARTVDINEEALRINEQATGSQPLPPQIFVQDFGFASPPSKAAARGLFQINPWPRRFDAIAAAKTNGAYASENVDMTGRSGDISYFANASNFVEDAPFVSLEGFRRQSARLNVDNQADTRWHIGLTTLYSKSRSGGNDDLRGFFNLLRVPTGIDLTQRDKFGRLLVRPNPLNYGNLYTNPIYQFAAERQTNEGDRFLGNVTARYTSGWLTLDGNLGFDKLGTDYLFLRDQDIRNANEKGAPPQGKIDRYNESQQAYNSSLNATATRTLGTRLDARWTARVVHERQRIETSDQQGTNLVVTDVTNTQAVRDSLTLRSTDQSVSSIGMLTGVNLVYRERYIADLLVRRDGSSLFGANHRWANYARGSAAWRLTGESWWPTPAVSDLKLRASLGTAGGRPRFDAQYESYTIASGGVLSAANTLGNKNLEPELTTELELGADGELFNRIGLNFTYAHAITTKQLLLVAPSVSSGFSNQWQNAGTLDNTTWEASLNLPLIRRRNLTWSARVNYDQNRPVITALTVPPYATCPGDPGRACPAGAATMFFTQPGGRIGTIYGSKFLTSCSELPAEYASQCGPGQEWQRNDEGLIVWIGKGNTPADGITRNLWQAERFGCVLPGSGAKVDVTGIGACKQAGGIVNAPNGVSNVWGNAMVLRDSTGASVYAPLGRTLPDFRMSLSQTLTFHRLSAYALLDASIGNDVFNDGRQLSFADFAARFEDQDGKTVASAKPLGHYWRSGAPESLLGNYGLFNVSGPNTISVEDASYAKLREVSLAYSVGAVRGVGDWIVSVVARNLHTFTHYSGFDPEVGKAGGQLGSGAINGVDAWQYPNVRTITLSLASRF